MDPRRKSAVREREQRNYNPPPLLEEKGVDRAMTESDSEEESGFNPEGL